MRFSTLLVILAASISTTTLSAELPETAIRFPAANVDISAAPLADYKSKLAARQAKPGIKTKRWSGGNIVAPAPAEGDIVLLKRDPGELPSAHTDSHSYP
jgi:hypothetical protein